MTPMVEKGHVPLGTKTIQVSFACFQGILSQTDLIFQNTQSTPSTIFSYFYLLNYVGVAAKYFEILKSLLKSKILDRLVFLKGT